MNEPRLRSLPLGARLGITCAVLVLLLGLASSLQHVREHHQNRDGEPGVSLDDLRGAYHGVSVRAPLVAALERGHPGKLDSAQRQALLAWLAGDKLSEQYDNPDLGDQAPAEILARDCASCHARKATAGAGIGAKLPLEYWDDVKTLAYAREIQPTPTAILLASTHTHALALFSVSVALGALVWCTRFSRRLRSGLIGLMGLALAADLFGWWLARWNGGLVLLIVVAGAGYVFVTAVSGLLVLLETWLPAKRSD